MLTVRLAGCEKQPVATTSGDNNHTQQSMSRQSVTTRVNTSGNNYRDQTISSSVKTNYNNQW
jgi:hypothetical protein